MHPKNSDRIIGDFVLARSTQIAATSKRVFPPDPATFRYPYTQVDYRLDGALIGRKILVDELAHAWSGGSADHWLSDSRGPSATEMFWNFFEEN